MGESFGAWTMGNDASLMDHVTSVNIACGFHAGDPITIRKTIETAIEKGVAIGAHPGYPDLQGFGRRNMSLSASDVFDMVLYQVAALKGICEASGGSLHHVKPHGALYNQAAKSPELSRAIANAVKAIDTGLIFYGGSGTALISEANDCGLQTASEVFADRTYQRDGSLTPRTRPDALINDSSKAVDQALQMVRSRTVTALSGETIDIRVDTICLHGDGAHALEFAVALRSAFAENSIDVLAL
jgi:5-oxoprolinase (ATP-hydrolysing) subunit A